MDKNDVLKVSKNMYAAIPALLDGMPMGFAVMRVLIDEEGEPFDFVYEYANSLFAYLENMSLESLKQYSWGQLFPDEEMQVLGAYANIALNGGNRVIEEVEEGGDKKLRINCYQPAYGYCALIVEEVPNNNNDVSMQKMPEEPVVTENIQTEEPQAAVPVTEEPQQSTPLLDETELQEMQKLAQMVAPVNEPEEVAQLEAVSEPQQAAPLEAIIEPETVAPLEQISEPEQLAPIEVTAPEAVKEAEAIAPLEPISEPQKPASVEPVSEPQQAMPMEVTAPEAVKEVEAIAPLEPISEPQQSAPIEQASEPQKPASIEPVSEPQQAMPMEVTVPEAVKEAEAIAPLEPISESQQAAQVAPVEQASEPQQAAPVVPVSEPQQIAPVEQANEPQQPAPEAVKEVEAVAPLEPISASQQAAQVAPVSEPQQAASVAPVNEPQQTAQVEQVSEPQQIAPVEQANEPQQPAPEAVKEAVAPLEPISEPQVAPVSEPQQAASVVPVSEPQQAASVAQVSEPQQAVSIEEVITGGVTVSHIVEESKPEGYATIADLMASASMNKEEPAQENTGEGTPIGSIVGSYGGDSEGVWSEPESNEDVVEFTEVETFEVDASENAESFESQEDTATFVAVEEDSGFDMQPIEDVKEPAPEPEPSVAAEPIEAVPELKADENSFMAKIKKVVESIDQFNEDMALEILVGLLNDSSLDENVAGDVRKVKAMVECSMFAEAKELAQTLVAS